MPVRTIAVEVAAARGWNKAEFAKRTGLSLSTIYSLSKGSQPSARAIVAIMSVIPDLSYERLFPASDSNKVGTDRSSLGREAVAA